MIGDRELLDLRLEYCALISMLFLEEPDAELMGLLAKDVRTRARGAEEMNPLLAEGWFQLAELCAEGADEAWAEACAGEYTTLFVGPGNPRLTPCESHYRSGRAYGVHLAHVRGFMERVGLEPAEGATEPEDHISFEFQILRHLIEKQGAEEGEGEEEWLALQGEFVRRHMGRWIPDLFEDAIKEEEAKFFEAFTKIASGYLLWEEEILDGWGPKFENDELLQIQDDSGWKGPMFDAEPPTSEPIEDAPASGSEN